MNLTISDLPSTTLKDAFLMPAVDLTQPAGQQNVTFTATDFWSYIASKLPTYEQTTVGVATTTVTLAAAYNQRTVVVRAVGSTIVPPALFASCGDGFECVIWNRSGSSATIGTGIVTYPAGTTTIAANQMALVRATNQDGTSGTFEFVLLGSTTAAAITPSIAISTIASETTSVPFMVSGTLSNYVAGPLLYYSDNSSTWAVLPSGATVSATSFSFVHPGLSANTSNTVWVKDVTGLTPVAQSNVFSVGSSSSPDQTVVLAGSTATILDSYGQVWGINTAGQITQNGVSDTKTSAVTQIAYVSGVLWQLGSALWWSWIQATGAWSSPGSSASPLLSAVITPTNVSASGTSMTAGVVSWTAVAAIGVTYVVQYSVHNLNSWTSVASSGTSATISGLLAATQYDVRVQSVKGSYSTAYSSIVTLTTTSTSVTVTGVPVGTAAGGNLKRMYSFWKMAGIQNHFGDTGGTNIYQSYAKTKAALDFMNPSGAGNGGPFVLRDETRAGTSNIAALGAAGYRMCIYEGYDGGTTASNAWNPQATNTQSLFNAGYVAYIEGPNEVINFNLAAYTAINGTKYSNQLAGVHWQMDLYNTYHGTTNCFGEPTPVIVASYGTGTTFGSTSFFGAAVSAGITLSNYADWSNVHTYLNYGRPWGGAGGQLDSEGANNSNGTGFTAKIKAATEAGMQHAMVDAVKWGSFHEVALLTPQMYFDAYKRNYGYIAFYELGDRGSGSAYENYWGWFDVNGLPYEAAVVMRWLASLTIDTGTNKNTFYTGNLTVSVSNLSSYGSSLWFQKTNGTVVGFIWDNAEVLTSGKAAITVPVKTCTVTFGATYGTINVYEPNVGASAYIGSAWTGCPVSPSAVKTVTNASSLTINMSDHAVVVVISP